MCNCYHYIHYYQLYYRKNSAKKKKKEKLNVLIHNFRETEHTWFWTQLEQEINNLHYMTKASNVFFFFFFARIVVNGCNNGRVKPARKSREKFNPCVRVCLCVTNERIKFCSLSRSSFPAVDVSISEEEEEKGLKVVDWRENSTG